MLELTVKTLDSQNHSFTVPNETTVRQLKESILEKMEVPVEIQRLIFHGKVLQDEKKLTDYGDVNGKVIHLVQRPPPAPSRTSHVHNTPESTQRSSGRRSHFNGRMDNSSTYLGAMAFPPDFVEAQDVIQLPQSQRFSRRRFLVAHRMLTHAGACITALENNESQQPSSSESQESAAASASTTTNSSGSGGEEANVFLGETTGSVAGAVQAATAAAIAAVVSAAHTVVPHINIRGASVQGDTLIDLDNSNSNMSSLNHTLNTDDSHHEDLTIEVQIATNSDVTVEECHDGEFAANNLDNPSSSNVAPSRLPIERTSSYAALVELLEEQQRRFQGLLRRCQQLMAEDPPLTPNSSPNVEECQRLFNGVSETMHYFAHAYHALSDIMVDFNENAPRTLRCRPVIPQHATFLETGFPIQAQISLSARRSPNASNSNISNGDFNQPQNNANRSDSQVQAESTQQDSTTNSRETSEPPQEAGTENVTSQESAFSFASTATQQSEERSQASHQSGGANPSGFFLSSPGNLEVFMDLRPESFTLGSVETTVILDHEARARNNAGGNILLRNLGSGHSPIEILQSFQAFAGQIQNHLMGRTNQSAQGDQPPPYDSNAQQTGSENSNQSASSQAQSSASTESISASQNIPNSLHHVRVSRTLPDSGLNSYDPFLPCNSHHVRSNSRTQNRSGLSQGAARPSNDNERSNVNSERDTFMAMMSPLLYAHRVNSNRGQGRQNQPSTTTTTSSPTASQSQRPAQSASNEQNANDSSRNFTWTPLLNNLGGWSVSASPSTSPGGRRNFWDFFRISPNDRSPPPGSTIAEFLSSVYDSSYVEGESLVSDFFMTLARNLTWPDLIELSMARRAVVESIVSRLHPALHTFVVQRLLQGETPSEESIARACERLYSELRPYVEVMQVARLRESVDLAATINNFNQSQIPEIVNLVVDPSLSQSSTFGQAMTRRVRNYVRQLMAIIIHCCQDGVQGFDVIVQNCVRLFTRGVPEDLQQWTEITSVNNLRYYTSTLNVPLEDIQQYFVYRIPNTIPEKRNPTPNVPEPMETDTSQNRTGWVQPEGLASSEKVEEPIAESLIDLDAENLPDVLIGSETWHSAIPSEWVPIIARDTQRQRRQSSQKPFSDAYLSSLPPKRRKLITSAKPQGTLSQVISDGVRHAINAAGISSTVAERAIAEAGKDDVLQEAYKEQERLVVSADLRKDPDFTPTRFPNAFKYFDKSNI